MYKLYHVTPSRNVKSIRSCGLRGRKGEKSGSPTDRAENILNEMIDDQGMKHFGANYQPREGSLFFYTSNPPQYVREGNSVIEINYDRVPDVIVAPDNDIEELFAKLRQKEYGKKVSIPSVSDFIADKVEWWDGEPREGYQAWGISHVPSSKLEFVDT